MMFSDTSSTPLNAFFRDQDLDTGQISGVITWHPPSETTHVVRYAVYLAEDASGAGAKTVATPDADNITLGINMLTLPANAAKGQYTYVLVYAASSLAEQ